MTREDVKLKFIAESLNEYFVAVEEEMSKRINDSNAKESGQLLRSLSHKVYQQQAQGNGNLNFAEWGRFLDMGVGRGHPLGGVGASSKKLRGKKNKKKTKQVGKRFANKIYSPVVYRQLNGLIGRLAYGFTEETINRIKNNIIT